MPPSTKNSAPVMKPLSGPKRKPTRAAMSSGRPTRPAGCCALSASDKGAPGGIDPAGTDAVHPDLGAQADGQGMRQRQQPAFGGGIRLGIGLGHVGAGGGHGHDGAVVGAQHRFGGPGKQEGAGEVGGEHAVPLRQREVGEFLADHETGIANHRIQSLFGGPDGFDGVLDVTLDSHVALLEACGLADRRRGCVASLVTIKQHDAPACTGEMPADRSPDAARPAGDESSSWACHDCVVLQSRLQPAPQNSVQAGLVAGSFIAAITLSIHGSSAAVSIQRSTATMSFVGSIQVTLPPAPIAKKLSAPAPGL